MIIGVDFDNTIVSYDALIYKTAIEKGIVPKGISPTKSGVRDFLRKSGKEDAWTELQGFIYGPCILEAEPFPGVMDFFKTCREKGIKAYIISHKTRYPFLGPKYDLHESAKRWLYEKGFYDCGETGISKEDVFLELTKKDKIKRISELGCTHFIDDLPEFLAEKSFPSNVVRILFDSNNKYKDLGDFEHAVSWLEIAGKLR
ncbi:HAD family hydrolase [Candidatus Woesearchaeota archaeon]|nr:HAD family hydrolase [Candidatus Woesearchaeota archaeon]